MASVDSVCADENSPQLQWSAADLETVASVLVFDQDQIEAARTLFANFETRTHRAFEKISAYTNAVRRPQSRGESNSDRLVRQASRKLQSYRDRIQEELYGDLRVLLTAEQIKRWPVFEREMRRNRSLGVGSGIAGGGFDVSKQTSLALGKTTPSPELESLLEEYRAAIDPSVRLLELLQQAIMEKSWSLEGNAHYELWTRSREQVEILSAARVARDVNLRFARAVIAMLDPESAQRFETQLYREASWRMESREGRGRSPEQVLQFTLSLQGLAAEELDRLKEIRDRYEPKVREMRRRCFEACLKAETEWGLSETMIALDGGAEHDAVRTAKSNSDNLALEIAREIEPMLSEEHLARAGPPFRAPPLPELKFDEVDAQGGLGAGEQDARRRTRSDSQVLSGYTSEIQLLSTLASLNPEQEEAIRSLYIAYGRRIDAAGVKLQTFYDAFEVQERAGHVEPAGKLHREAGHKYQAFKHRLRQDLEGDLQAILSEGQLNSWPVFERELRRRGTLYLGYSVVFKSSFDVADEVNRAMEDRKPSPELAAVVEEYKLAVDRPVRALEASDRALDERRHQTDGTMTFKLLNSFPERKSLVQAARAVRDVNLRFAKAVIPLLVDASRDAFEESLYRTTSWRYSDGRETRPTPWGTLYRVLALPDLTEVQKSGLQQIWAEFRPVDRDYSRRLFEAQIRVQSALTDEQVMEERSLEAFPEVETVCAEGDALVAQIAERIRPLLTEDQIAKLGLVVRSPVVPTLEFDD